ncbi:hypothetical protein [Actinomadura rupiterrae]|uniref:hypothetical protein n=1 Tax=Actinomadura rupiterrae TaxID=559627 RepID=UPI0020A27577|nr:hypothetical protein [Actinomadura rupiterrae]MCP2343740.1 hypothetical protein [Actinomadura rupiterrae]
MPTDEERAAAKSAAAEVVRSWRRGRILLSGYLAAVAVILWPWAYLDRSLRDLAEATGLALIGGFVLLGLVSLRNAQAGAALAKWKPGLRAPVKLFAGPRLRHRGGLPYMVGLLTVTSVSLLVLLVSDNLAATAKGTAHVKCSTEVSSGRTVTTTTTCRGTWVVAGRTYSSGKLPRKAWDGTIHYAPDDPSTLGDRSLNWPITFVLVGALISAFTTRRWITRSRDPYLAKVERLATRRLHPRPTPEPAAKDGA